MTSPIRFCPLCKQADDHPRHTFANTPNDIAPHLDCCKAAGCPDGMCDITTAGAEDLRGDKLRAHLIKNGDKHNKLADERDDTTRHHTFADITHLYGPVGSATQLQGVDQ